MKTTILKTKTLATGVKLMHLKQANTKAEFIQYCEPIKNPKQ